MSVLSQKLLKALFQYDATNGILIRRVSRGGKWAGTRAGCLRNGYWDVVINKQYHRLTKVIWIYVTGLPPPVGFEIDHKDKDPSNNRWDNLRLLTRSQNQAHTSRYKNNKSGFKGVHRTRHGLWRAMISIEGKNHCLGTFLERQNAVQAYQSKRLEVFGEL